jgi:hypothetical protein
MQSIKLAKALLLSVVTLTASYAMAESGAVRDPATTPSDQTATAATSDCCSKQEGMMDHSMMNDSDMMAMCKKMHKQMHQDMMQEDEG